MGWLEGLKTLLIAIAPSLAARVMSSIGIGVISYASLTALTNTVISNVNSSYGLIGSVPLAFLNLSGFSTAITIITSAIVTRVTLTALKKFVPI